MMLFLQKLSSLSPFFLLPLAAVFLSTSAHGDNDDRRSMAGVWYTNTPAGWVVQTEDGSFSGVTGMRWELEEDEGGLISGFNIWFSPNPEEGHVALGAMCMVGARDGSRVVITEASVVDRLLPTFEFNCKRRKGNRARCLGAGLADQPPVALQGEMTRVSNPGERDHELAAVAIGAVRDFCRGLLVELPNAVYSSLPHLALTCAPMN